MSKERVHKLPPKAGTRFVVILPPDIDQKGKHTVFVAEEEKKKISEQLKKTLVAEGYPEDVVIEFQTAQKTKSPKSATKKLKSASGPSSLAATYTLERTIFVNHDYPTAIAFVGTWRTGPCSPHAPIPTTLTDNPDNGDVEFSPLYNPYQDGTRCLIFQRAVYTWDTVTAASFAMDFFSVNTGPVSTDTNTFDTNVTVYFDDGKYLGPPCSECDPTQATTDYTGGASAGEPIDLASGNMYFGVTDYKTAGAVNQLTFTRSYNSGWMNNYISMLGRKWSTNYDSFIEVISSTRVIAVRPGGQQIGFNYVGSAWVTDSDVDMTLTKSGSTWTLTDAVNTVETYTTTSGSFVLVDSITQRNGYAQTMTYNGSKQLTAVTDSYSRTLGFGYTSGRLTSLTTPESNVFTYTYNVNDMLEYVISPAEPPSVYTSRYLYTDPLNSYFMTAEYNRYGDAINEWTYDSYGRAITSSQGGSGLDANLTTVAYDDTNGERTVTNALGVADTFSFSTSQYVRKVSGISRAATATTPSMSRSFTYDNNGYMNSQTDWNGVSTTYVNNAKGNPTTINEAVGTGAARTTTIAYNSTWPELPDTITVPGLTTTFTYDGSGNMLTRTGTDTTTQTVPYSTNGQTRTWTYTYNGTGQVLTVTNPRTDLTATTTFTYSSGGLASITNALSQATSISSRTAGGYPLTVVDPNGVTTTLTYDGNMRLLTRNLSTAGGTRTTTYEYWSDDLIYLITQPDGTEWYWLYDYAQRLIDTGPLDDSMTFTLNALGKPVLTEYFRLPTSTLTQERSATYDALNRKLTDTNGVNKTTTYTYDDTGNLLTATDPLSNTNTYTYDALNRRDTITDANSATTTIAYDARSRVTSVTDAYSAVTSYVYNGFGDVIQVTTPPYMAVPTVYVYDKMGNLTQKTDAESIVANYTYDALNRQLTATYPASSGENVAFTYDQSGHGKGIGRLTTFTDASGSGSRDYDERGNVTVDSRTHGAVTLTTSYAYNANGWLSSITYPSGAVQGYTYDDAGKIAGLAFASGLTTATGTATHMPFGGLETLAGYTTDTAYTYDLAGRMTAALGQYSSTTLMDWAYDYDDASNVILADNALTSANTQEFWYFATNRLESTAWGWGIGGHDYRYDNVGNMNDDKRRVSSVVVDELVYTNEPGNRISNIYDSATTTNHAITTNQNGSITGISPAFASNTIDSLVYNNAGRLAQVKNGGTTIGSYTYDAFGLRRVKTLSASGRLYVYGLNGELLSETDASGTPISDYIYVDGRLVAVWTPGTSLLASVQTDRMMVPNVATDGAGAVTWSAEFEPFGKTRNLTASGTTINLRLPGQYYDAESGYYYNIFRTYNPQWGRYLEEDPIGLAGGLNLRSYVGNMPTRYTDFLGLKSWNPYEDIADRVAGIGQNPEVFTPQQRIDLSMGLDNLTNYSDAAALATGITGNIPAATTFAGISACSRALSEYLNPNTPKLMEDLALDVLTNPVPDIYQDIVKEILKGVGSGGDPIQNMVPYLPSPRDN